MAQAGNTAAFRQEGVASWYGSEFDGKPTASGEVFNSDLLTAAHPNLPFGTMLTVINKQNNRQVTVRVNDRGPFVAARIIDISKAAAEVLDMISIGTAPVIIERVVSEITQAISRPSQVMPQPSQAATEELNIDAATTYEAPALIAQPAAVPEEPAVAVSTLAFYPAPPAVIRGSMPSEASARLYRLQVGSYKIPRNATDAFDKLRKAGLDPAYEQSGDYYRVVLAGVRAGEIQTIAQTLGNAGFREALIREEQ